MTSKFYQPARRSALAAVAGAWSDDLQLPHHAKIFVFQDVAMEHPDAFGFLHGLEPHFFARTDVDRVTPRQIRLTDTHPVPLPFDDLKLCAMQMKRVVHVGLIVDFPQLYLASTADKIHTAEVECLAIDEEFHATWAFICRRARLEHCRHLHTFGKRNLLHGLRFPKTCQRSQSDR